MSWEQEWYCKFFNCSRRLRISSFFSFFIILIILLMTTNCIFVTSYVACNLRRSCFILMNIEDISSRFVISWLMINISFVIMNISITKLITRTWWLYWFTITWRFLFRYLFAFIFWILFYSILTLFTNMKILLIIS